MAQQEEDVQAENCDCNDCRQERRRLELVKDGVAPKEALRVSSEEREAYDQEDTIYCKFCYAFKPLAGANSHQDGWVCEECWDERLRITQ